MFLKMNCPACWSNQQRKGSEETETMTVKNHWVHPLNPQTEADRAVFKGGGVYGFNPPEMLRRKFFGSVKKARPAKCER